MHPGRALPVDAVNTPRCYRAVGHGQHDLDRLTSRLHATLYKIDRPGCGVHYWPPIRHTAPTLTYVLGLLYAGWTPQTLATTTAHVAGTLYPAIHDQNWLLDDRTPDVLLRSDPSLTTLLHALWEVTVGILHATAALQPDAAAPAPAQDVTTPDLTTPRERLTHDVTAAAALWLSIILTARPTPGAASGNAGRLYDDGTHPPIVKPHLRPVDAIAPWTPWDAEYRGPGHLVRYRHDVATWTLAANGHFTLGALAYRAGLTATEADTLINSCPAEDTDALPGSLAAVAALR